VPARRSLTIAGLGPGDPGLLTLDVQRALAAASEVWLRTRRHPVVEALPAGPRYGSFDEIYERGDSFDAVYEAIVERVIGVAQRAEGTVYAVPGHPLFGEATVREIVRRAPDAGIDVTVLPGVSFLDAVAVSAGFDPLEHGCLMLDALELGPRGRSLSPGHPTVIAQVYDRRAASRAKLALLDVYPADHRVQVIRYGKSTVTVPLSALDHQDVFDHLTTLYLPAVVAYEDVRTFAGLRQIVAKLRDPVGGCPWDLQQTHESLKHYMLEEAYEAIDAIDAGDPARLSQELGDVLMQVLLHAQLGEDAGEFTIEDVIHAIAAKLVRRHPHVFGAAHVEDAEHVLRNWETLKAQERGDAPLLDAVPRGMPALMQAQSVQSRAEHNGAAPPVSPPTLDDLRPLADAGAGLTVESLGDLLFQTVAAARRQGIDAEEALRGAISRYRTAVETVHTQPGRS